MGKNIFVTGASGCVGHYLFDLLSKNPDYNLHLLIRNKRKIMFDYSQLSNVAIIEDCIENVEKYAGLIKETDILIHLLADWGGAQGNFDYTLALFNCVDLNRCKKVIYLSTASILGPGNKPVEQAGVCGTPYIRGKFMLHKKLKELKLSDRTITLYPTWVLGGDNSHPISHASAAISAAKKYLWFLRFFTLDASFHFIHAQDIASIIYYLIGSAIKNGEFVLGNDVITADSLIKKICARFKKSVYFQIPISASFIKMAASMVGKKLSSWDLYCLDNPHQEFNVVNAKTFGLASRNFVMEDVLKGLAFERSSHPAAEAP